jgi:hypothetical protein
MMEYWGLGNWDVDTLEKLIVDMGGKVSNENIPFKTTFHFSTIPFFHVRGKNMCPGKTFIISYS